MHADVALDLPAAVRCLHTDVCAVPLIAATPCARSDAFGEDASNEDIVRQIILEGAIM
jgi:hypothetical protein